MPPAVFYLLHREGILKVDSMERSPEPFFLQGHGSRESTAILAVHGFTGSPAEFHRAGRALNQVGYTIDAIRLPGHGTTPERMLETGWSDWWQHVLDSYESLRLRGYDKIVVLGHSMGGLLALKLAMERPVDGIVSLAAPVYLWTRKTALAFLLRYIVDYVEKKPSAAQDILNETWAYSRAPVVCVISLRQLMRLVRRSLADVRAPIFIGQGTKDGTVRPRSALYIYERVSSGIKDLRFYPRSSHALLLDRERENVYADIGRFVDDLCGIGGDAGCPIGAY